MQYQQQVNPVQFGQPQMGGPRHWVGFYEQFGQRHGMDLEMIVD
jgi:hypothetical protein